MNAGGFGGCDVGGLTVQEQVGERGPNERSAHVGHLAELVLTQRDTVNQHQFADKQVVLHEDVEFCTAAFIHAFCDVNEPRVQFAAGVSRLDVVAHVVGRQFGDLGVNFVSSEVVILDVSGEDGSVAVIRVAWTSLGGGGTTDEGLHLDVLHGLRFHVPVRS